VCDRSKLAQQLVGLGRVREMLPLLDRSHAQRSTSPTPPSTLSYIWPTRSPAAWTSMLLMASEIVGSAHPAATSRPFHRSSAPVSHRASLDVSHTPAVLSGTTPRVARSGSRGSLTDRKKNAALDPRRPPRRHAFIEPCRNIPAQTRRGSTSRTAGADALLASGAGSWRSVSTNPWSSSSTSSSSHASRVLRR